METRSEINYGYCPYCQTDCLSHEDCVSCQSCGSVHHRECWDENQGCALFGCIMAPVVEKRSDIEVPHSYWGKEYKECPKCGKEILAAAVRCRYCGARFASQRPLDSSEFNNIESVKKRHPAIKRTIIIFFITNIMTCIAPIAAMVTFIWYSKNRKAISTLPSLFRTLIVIAMVTGVSQTVLIGIMGILYSLFKT